MENFAQGYIICQVNLQENLTHFETGTVLHVRNQHGHNHVNKEKGNCKTTVCIIVLITK